MIKNTKTPLKSPCHTVARCGMAWHARGKLLKYRGNKKWAVKSLFLLSNPLFLWLCSLLRRVCVLNRPKGATLAGCRGFQTPLTATATTGLHWRAAALSVLLCAFGSSSVAQNWVPVSSTTEWRSRTGFVENFSAPVTPEAVPLSGTRKLDQLLSIIALAEADNGYDSVQHAARIKPPKHPTQMTVDEIYAWIEATPGQHHAIGRYQFIPPTLRDLMRQLGVPSSARFDRALQDRLALALVNQAGYRKFQAGEITATKFMDGLLPVSWTPR